MPGYALLLAVHFAARLDTLIGMNSAWMDVPVLKGRNGLWWAFGIVMILTLNASATVRYEDLNCTTATPPLLTWETSSANVENLGVDHSVVTFS